MDKVAKMLPQRSRPATRLSSVLRDLMLVPKTLSPEDAAAEAADRVIAAVEKERAERKPLSS